MRDPRPYYRARVLLVPVGTSARDAIDRMGADVVEGVELFDGVLTNGSLAGPDSAPDVLMFVTADLAEVDGALLSSLAAAGRHGGALVAAITMDTPADDDARRRGLRALREHVDMLLSVRNEAFAAGFIEVVRGGKTSVSRPHASDG